MTKVAGEICECGHFTHSDRNQSCMITGCDCMHYSPKRKGASVMAKKSSGNVWEKKDEKKDYSSWGKYTDTENFLKDKKNYIVSLKNALTGEEDMLVGCYLNDMQARLAAITRKEYIKTDGWYVESVKE